MIVESVSFVLCTLVIMTSCHQNLLPNVLHRGGLIHYGPGAWKIGSPNLFLYSSPKMSKFQFNPESAEVLRFASEKGVKAPPIYSQLPLLRTPSGPRVRVLNSESP